MKILLPCFAALFAILCVNTLAIAQEEDTDSTEFIDYHTDDNAAALRVTLTPTQRTRVSSAIADFNQNENNAVRKAILAEANGGNEAREKIIVEYRSGRKARQAKVNADMKDALGATVADPSTLAMTFPEGSTCENLSLRYKFKKSKVWVYPRLASDVGQELADQEAKDACKCAKSIKDLPCFNGSVKIATGETVKIMP
jgi:hypothetical protein